MGVRVDVNAMFGEGVDVGYGGCESRLEGIVQCTKRYCTILRKLKNCGGRGRGNICTQNTLYVFKRTKKISKRKQIDLAVIRTHDLWVRKTCSLIH